MNTQCMSCQYGRRICNEERRGELVGCAWMTWYGYKESDLIAGAIIYEGWIQGNHATSIEPSYGTSWNGIIVKEYLNCPYSNKPVPYGDAL